MRHPVVLALTLICEACIPGSGSAGHVGADEPDAGLPGELPDGGDGGNGGDAGSGALTGRVTFVSTRDGTSTYKIYVADPDGSHVTSLTAGDWPAWRPGGTQIAFSQFATGGISVIDADGTNEVAIGPTGGAPCASGSMPSWSPDGTMIAFSTSAGLCTMNANGSNPQLMVSNTLFADGSGAVDWPSWSPDGTRIAFVVTSNDDAWLTYLVPADGSAPAAAVPNIGAIDTPPAWTSDSRRFAYHELVNGTEWGIISVQADGTDLEVLATNPAGFIGNPTWASDNVSIACEHSAPYETPTRIFIVRPDGTQQQLIPDADTPINASYWDLRPRWYRGS